jgi:hypothetical protein
MAFWMKNFNKKNPPYGFFALMSNLTKVPFWTNRFKFDCFDWVFLVGVFNQVFLLNHHDNNITWATIKNIYYLKLI